MHVNEHIGEGDLERRIKSAKRPKLRQRLRAVLWAMRGETAPQVADRVGLSRRQVQHWVARFNADGISGLRDRPGRGRKLPLNAQQIERLRERLDAPPREEDEICSFRGEDIRCIIETELGVKRSLGATYYLLHQIGYSWLVPRPRHPQADPQKQAAFKKDAPNSPR